MGWKTNIPSSEVVLYTTRQAEKAAWGGPGVLLSGVCREDGAKLYWDMHGDSMRGNGKAPLDVSKRLHNEWQDNKQQMGLSPPLDIIQTCLAKTGSNVIYFQTWP